MNSWEKDVFRSRQRAELGIDTKRKGPPTSTIPTKRTQKFSLQHCAILRYGAARKSSRGYLTALCNGPPIGQIVSVINATITPLDLQPLHSPSLANRGTMAAGLIERLAKVNTRLKQQHGVITYITENECNSISLSLCRGDIYSFPIVPFLFATTS